ncbi:hypothetical protein G6F58_013150 [Rhizopus delemar]|nr:hypothetical protein G6F58_013150 [Rhizopus delemar]
MIGAAATPPQRPGRRSPAVLSHRVLSDRAAGLVHHPEGRRELYPVPDQLVWQRLVGPEFGHVQRGHVFWLSVDAIAHGADHVPGCGPDLRTRHHIVRQGVHADPGAAPVLPAHAVPQPGRAADLRYP